jgi:hypothetical protein
MSTAPYDSQDFDNFLWNDNYSMIVGTNFFEQSKMIRE